jgi:hypothetical protein
MNESIYAPPKADLSTAADIGSGSNGDDVFYVVSLTKLTVLFFCTLGTYQIFWAYKNWSNYKDRCRYIDSPDRNIWPIPRAIFSLFFVHSLFHKVEDFAEEKSRPLTWSIDTNATLLVFLLLASAICDRMSRGNVGSPVTDIASVLLLFPLYFCYRHAQIRINAACGDPQGQGNSKFTVANWIWIVCGTIVCLLALAGLILPDPDA